MRRTDPSIARHRLDHLQEGHTRSGRVRVVGGSALMLIAAPATAVVAVMTAADWAYLAALATFVVGLLAVGGVVASNRSTFRGGTRIWENDGLPGGGGGGAA